MTLQMNTTIVKTRDMSPSVLFGLSKVNRTGPINLTTVRIRAVAPVVLWYRWSDLAEYWLGFQSVPDMFKYSVFETGPRTNTEIKQHDYMLYEVAPKHYRETKVYLYLAHKPIIYKETTVEAWYVTQDYVIKQ